MPRDSCAFSVGVAAAALLALAALWRRRRRHDLRFDFERLVDRSGAHTVKHDLAAAIYGAEANDALHMWVADMELPCCPHIQRALAERARHPTFGYTLQPRAIWEAVGQWLVQRQGWPAAPEPASFVFSASVVTSFCNVIDAFSAPGDGVVVMTPLYGPLQALVSARGRRLVRHTLRPDAARGRYELDVARLEAALDGGVSILLLCSPHNPSGRVWRRHELAAIARACAARGVLLVADEIWADWVLPAAAGGGAPGAPGGAHFVPCSAVAAAAGCALVTLGAPTKSWSLAGLHASYAVLPDAELRRRYLARAEPAFLAFGSTFATAAMLAAYARGAAWLDACRAHVAANACYLRAFLAAHVPEVVAWPPEATYLVWLDCAGLVPLLLRARRARRAAPAPPAPLPPATAPAAPAAPADVHGFALRRARLLLSAGDEFAPDGGAAHFLRMNVACPRAMLITATERLRGAVRELRAEAAQAEAERARTGET